MPQRRQRKSFPRQNKTLLLILLLLLFIAFALYVTYRQLVTPLQVAEVGTTIPTPTNLTHTCSSDNTSVTLSWDDVSPGNYNLAFNNPTNDDDAGWYKPDSQDVWRGGDLEEHTYQVDVTPHQRYNWWVQSNEAGPNSPKSERANAELVCPAPPPATPSPRTSLRHSGTTCRSLSFAWDKVKDAPDYLIELADNPEFNNPQSSGIIGPANDSYTFENLMENHSYYARITLGNIHDFPRYTTLPGVITSFCNPPVVAKPSVRPTAKPTPKPSPSPSPRSSLRPSSSPLSFSPNPSSIPLPESNLPDTNPGFFERLLNFFQSLFD